MYFGRILITMKNYILLITLLICSQIGFSQVDVNIDKTISFEEEANENYTPYEYIGNGVYKYSLNDYCYQFEKNEGKNFVKFRLNPLIEKLEEFCRINNYSYEVVSNTTKEIDSASSLCDWTYLFRLKDASGNPLITKKEATKELIELKKLMDLGVLTKEEFDSKAKSLKAIILK